MKSLAQELKANLNGNVRFDNITKAIYSSDASIYEIEPIGVVVPKTKEEVITAVKIAAHYKVPVLPRGAATGTTGGCVGKALIIDVSKHLNQIHDINYKDKYAICEPGVVQDHLNSKIAARNLCFGPDTSTGSRATLGGMVGNNSSGAHSITYGKMVDNTIALELIVADGTVLVFDEIDEETFDSRVNAAGIEGRIYTAFKKIREEKKEDIDKAFPKIERRVSGYNLDELIKPFPLNLAKVIVGSEGTLGIVTKVKVDLCEKPTHTLLCVLLFDDLKKALDSVDTIMELAPYSLELIDKKIVEMGRQSAIMKDKLDWLKTDPELMLVTEISATNQSKLEEKLVLFKKMVSEKLTGCEAVILESETEKENVWKLRKSGLGLLMSKRSHKKAIAFLEDVAVAPQKMSSFMVKFRDKLEEHGKEASFYGHAGAGCIHVRPMMDLSVASERELMTKLMHETADLLHEYGGALSGEHGDGLIRSWMNEKMFGASVYQAFKDLKYAFDPENLMNPGKIIEAQHPEENLRTRKKEELKINTMFDFSKQGGLYFAVDMCNGNGECRKTDSGIMCPSFQGSKDELQSTRARAQALKSSLNGSVDYHEFTGKKLYDILDLCLECKGCKTECPSEVDMAKLKSEFLYHYQEKNGYKFRSRVFASVDKFSKVGSFFAPFSNYVLNTPVKKMFLSMLGISAKRSLPHFEHRTFSKWCRSNPQKGNKEKGQVVLFNDTFTEHNNPHVGSSAFHILDKLGFEIIIPPRTCCGRPAISKGLLKEAVKKAKRLVQKLLPYAEKGLPIIGLEPSCILTIKDDYTELIPSEDAEKVAACCIPIDDFLDGLLQKGELDLNFKTFNRKILFHGHCYQKALTGTQGTMNVLKNLPGAEVEEVNSGCCGMAGTFGYEKEHYQLSLDIGEQRLFPAVRKADWKTEIIANGMSCRCQVAHGADRTARHMVEILDEYL